MPPEGIIIGLGNPGPKYRTTRHNFGFLVADALLESYRAPGRACVQLKSSAQAYELWSLTPGPGRDPWLVLKPMTYMNRSGDAAAPVVRYFRIPLDKVVAVHDELDLSLGRVKLKFGGGAAGHKGVSSLAQSLGSPDFYRLRLGVGRPQGMDGAAWVLSPFAAAEWDLARETVPVAIAGVEAFWDKGAVEAQRLVNSHVPPALPAN